MPFGSNTRLPLALASPLVLLALGSTPAEADCTIANNVVTCTGDVSAQTFGLPNQSLIARDLTSNIEGGLSIQVLGQDGSGISAGVSELSFDGGSFGITQNTLNAPLLGLSAISRGGTGGGGRSAGGEFRPGDATGGSGQSGGFGDLAQLTFTSGTTTTQSNRGNAMLALSQGADGGGGGDARSSAGTVRGGSGGTGGSGAQARVIIDNATVNFTSSGVCCFPALQALAVGGDGGNGASGVTDNGNAHGGHGGQGGAGGDASFTMSAGFVQITDLATGISVISQAGDGGNGGNADTGVSAEANAGAGGRGGDGGAVAVRIGPPASSLSRQPVVISMNGIGKGSIGIRLASNAGDGGDGGKADSELIGSARGGDGGAGGSGGSVDANILANIGSQSTDGNYIALFAQSYGGSGGDGGEGRTLAGRGSGGAAAGSGPGGDVTITYAGNIGVGETEGLGMLVQSVGGFAGAGGKAEGFEAYGAGSQSAGAGGTVSLTIAPTEFEIGSTISTTGDEAVAVQVQSVGGGGGHGSSGDGIDALGGSGSAGGDGGKVTLTFETAQSDVNTEGFNADALVVQSVGGGGGSAGSVGGVRALGGSAGSGGDGGDVEIDLNANVITRGGSATAILASSVGGGGGSAHSTDGLNSIGGSGGDGGAGGSVSIVNKATDSYSIITDGSDADAVVMQSIGGGGGHGSNALSVSSNYAQAVGGRGGDGGSGGSVSYQEEGNSQSSITTQRDRSRGLVLQSVGGGGGHGGGAISVTVPSFIAAVSLGTSGDGGTAGAGGAVTFSASDTAVSTKGEQAAAIHAQSVGGGGGSAGTAIALTTVDNIDFAYAIGGSGGSGGAGGTVDLTSSNQSLSTAGDQSAAVFAQSIGGGGGHGGTSVSGNLGTVLAASPAIGGTGGGGGDGGAVTLSVDSAIETGGELSYGIQAQSVGGGGGHGGTTLSLGAISLLSADVGLGGAAGDGGAGGKVEVSQDSSLATTGDEAIGIFAQSVGGGGGSSGLTGAFSAVGSGANVTIGGAGGSGGRGGAVTVDAEGQVTTEGEGASGIRAQSVGGGGGHSGITLAASAASNVALDFNANVALGGAGGSGGDGAAVTVTARDISTTGANALGVAASSIGGGGGSSHFSGAFDAFSGVTADVTVGGAGGDAGDGGAVSVSLGGAIQTAGNNATGILATSIGGGGGDSGISVSGSGISTPADFAVGGQGGNSGDGGKVEVDLGITGTVTTKGDNAEGVLASSIARGGGHSGYVGAGAGIVGGASSMSVGGKGGSAGSAGDVTVSGIAPTLSTTGSFSNAVTAQSVGGSGGSAKGSITADALAVGDLSLTIGGDGAAGGTGGTVSVSLPGATVKTEGHNAVGVLSQSIGGAGGNGGFAAEASITAGKVSGEAGLSIGGSGGGGGSAGDASVVLRDSSVETGNIFAPGVLVQSVGGGGGNGGNVYTGNATLSQTASADVNVAIGGNGGLGGSAGSASFNAGPIGSQSSITTSGFLSPGIIAQSVGGMGGSGGSVYTLLATAARGSNATVDVDVGGTGGSGQDAGAVSVTYPVALDITTGAGGSHGVLALSVGGGGGQGGTAASINLQPLPSSDVAEDDSGSSLDASLSVSVGGSGGSGGDGDMVTVDLAGGDITTKGDSAKGVYALSVGGGGGDGGTASATSFSFDGICNALSGGTGYVCQAEEGDEDESTDVTVSSSVVVGGSGGAAGKGGEVNLKLSNSITTEGALSHAVVGHSIGGGGGNGGEGALGITGWTTNETANSIANLPGNFTFIPEFTDVDVSVGGAGGAAGDGSAVSISTGFLTKLSTSGDHAYGIHAQSVGGGGGNGAAGSSGFWAAATVGGRGSGGGDGGDISVDTSQGSQIETSGDGAVGLFAQSVGGGGGTAGDIEKGFSDAWADLNIGAGVGVQLDAGSGGDGGDITLDIHSVATSGALAHGIVAQSVGGSGGVLGVSGFLGSEPINNFAGNVGDAGSGGDIKITIDEGNTSGIRVSGEGAHGIFAQSVGGTGSGDTSGDITLDLQGDVTASGKDGRAILAQSEAADASGNGTIAITIAEGVTVATGSEGAETIGLLDGNENKITNNGTLRNGSSAIDSFVIRTNGGADLTIRNNGLLEGQITIPESSALPETIFVNASGASYGMGGEANLGFLGTLENNGTMSAGTVGTVGTTEFTGALTQNGSGTLQVDYAFAGGNDLIIFGGGLTTSSLAGRVLPNPVDSLPTNAQIEERVILSSDNPLGTVSLSVESTAVITYAISREMPANGPDQVILTYEVDYSPWDGSEAAQAKVSGATAERVGERHSNLGDHIDELIALRQADLAAGTEEVAFVNDLVDGLLAVEEVSELVDIYDRLAPAEIFAPADAAFFSSQRFANALQSCPRRGEGRQAVFTQEGSCVWLQVGGGGVDRQRDGDTVDYDETYVGVSLGGQMALADGFFLGGAFGYEDSNLSNSRFSADGSRFQGGIAAKKEIQATTLSLSLSGGVGSYDASREVFTPGGNVTADSSPNVNWVGGHARVAHVFDVTEEIYLNPQFDLGVTHQWQGDYAESGAGDYGLDVEGFNTTMVSLNPVLEVGSGFEIFGAQANATAAAGLLAIVSGRERATDVAFLGTGGGGPSFEITDKARPVFADLSLGFNLLLHEQVVISLGGQALLAGNQQEYGGSGRISFLF
ncbi:MAG: hypothetical protein AAFY02_18995 [Pseudomonadota bacterium]